jgi:hypothetical protein
MPGEGWHGARWPVGADDIDPGTPSAAVSVVSGIAKVELTSRSGAVAFYAAYSRLLCGPGNPPDTYPRRRVLFSCPQTDSKKKMTGRPEFRLDRNPYLEKLRRAPAPA